MLSTPIGIAVALGQSSGAALVDDMGLGANYLSEDDGAGPGLSASVTVTVKRDGTWTVTVGGDDTLTGTPTSGTWATVPATDVGDGFEVLFDDTTISGAPTINDSTGGTWAALTSDQTFQVIAAGGASVSVDLTVSFRPTGGSTGLTDMTNLDATGG